MSVLEFWLHYPSAYLTSVFIVGLLVGSFLNVVILRLPVMLHHRWRQDCIGYLSEHQPQLLNPPPATAEPPATFNLVVPRSRCPHCGHLIRAWENIPVLSYLLLRGRCAHCQAGIAARYPLIELAAALLAVLSAWQFGVSLQALAAIVLGWALLSLSMIDYDHQYLPDQIVLPLLWAGLLLNSQGLFTDLHSALLGAAAGYLILWLVYQLFKLLTGKEGMGYGDFKLLAMLGAWLGWQMLPAIILLSSLVGSLVGISLILLKLQQREKPIPFGPYLASAGWIALLWGAQLNQAYLDWLT